MTEPAPLTIRYFAWLRELVGLAEEQLHPPPEITTVAALIPWLAGRDAAHAHAFAARASIRCAVNQEFATPEARLAPGDEIAFFPPVTGG
ncbi:MAG: molybdopterin converting factor subunit 1 [Acetobacteraceae bacterium]